MAKILFSILTIAFLPSCIKRNENIDLKERLSLTIQQIEKKYEAMLPCTVEVEKTYASGQNKKSSITSFDLEGLYFFSKNTPIMPVGSQNKIGNSEWVDFAHFLNIGNPVYAGIVERRPGTQESFLTSNVNKRSESQVECFHPIRDSCLASAWNVKFSLILNDPNCIVEADASTGHCKLIWSGVPFWRSSASNPSAISEWTKGEFKFDLINNQCIEQSYQYGSDPNERGRYIIEYKDGVVNKWESYDLVGGKKYKTTFQVIDFRRNDSEISVEQCYLKYYGLPEPQFAGIHNWTFFSGRSLVIGVALIATVMIALKIWQKKT
jgi:hypothetical protein